MATWTRLVGIGALVLMCIRCAQPGASERGAQTAPSERPTLVVLIVLDQFGEWVFEKYLPLLPEDSAIRRAHRTGATHIVEFPFAATATAPGHTTLVTGVTPAIHGVVANEVYDPVLGTRKLVDDRKHAVLGGSDRYAAPIAIRSPTVADMLHVSTAGAAKAVALSIKARSAVFSAGREANVAAFYDREAQGLTTSTFYAPDGVLPEWLDTFNQDHPVEALLTVWRPGNPDWLARHFGADGKPGAGHLMGWDNRFPYDPKKSSVPLEAFAFMPQSTEYLLEAALAAIDRLRMGEDEVPDFLAISVSGTDLVGHIWGPESWEYADNLLRTDRALTKLADQLERRGRVAVVLTADHGVAPMPQRSVAEGRSSGRLVQADVVLAAEAAADVALGDGDWIAGYVQPLITYTEQGKDRRRELTAALIETMPQLEGVHRAFDALDGAALRARPDDPIANLVGASLPENPPGDLYLVSDPYWFDALKDLAPDEGTSHGTPWEYDRRVPVLMWGAGIERAQSDETLDARSVAVTLAALLGVPPPPKATVAPLPGVHGHSWQ